MNRKYIKEEARSNLFSQYFKSILVVFIASIVISGFYHFNSDYNSNIYNNVITQNDQEKIYDNKIVEHIKDNNHKEGVIGPIVHNTIENRSIVKGFLNYLNNLLFKRNFSAAIISFIATYITLMIYIFIRNVIQIGEKRYFLEQRRYHKTPVDRLLFPYKLKRNFHIAITLILKDIFQVLWDLTIVGGFIKHYEYKMIPYILAENPNIKTKEAFKISKEMVYGYKWELFKLDLSLFGWVILNIVTVGFSNLLFTNAYVEAIDAEVYMYLRKKNHKNITNNKLLNDKYLDIKKAKDGIYPSDKYQFEFHKSHKTTLDYDKKYTIQDYIMFFFTFALAGWLWEVMYHLVTEGTFVNRGTMLGPWLPIYGFGGILILIILKPVRKKPALLFVLAMLLAGVLEYSTAWYLETFNGLKWWDYTGFFMNINGRVCLEGLLVFGLGGAAVTYFIAPILESVYKKINHKTKWIICSILLILYGIDFIYSTYHPNTGEGITEFKNEVIK
ncbi:MAG: DUF975 family protein [Bacilli bacterium]|nr:DUF975 family protein [Bacilli bacterium]